MGHFVRTAVAAQHPFNVDLNTGEDFDYYLRLWEHQRCVKIDKIFFANRRGQQSTGPRSATGEDWRRTVDGLIDNTLKRIGLDRARPEGRRIVNAKSLEYRDFARAHKLATPKTYFILSRVLPYHGEWTVNCYNCAPFVMTSANDDLVVSSIIWTDTFEPTSMSVWLRLASAPGVVLDIGGYTGVYALVAASRNRENAIFCFEPLACNHRRIAANFALNDLPRLTLVPVAVGESDGEVTLNVFADGDFLTSGSSLVNEGKQASKRCDMVQCVAVDSFVKERGLSRISLVKIDVEGAELNVLHGMQGVIERDHPDILIEVLSDKVGASLTEFLGGHGYRFFEIHEGTDAVRPVDRLTGAGDLENLNRLVTTKSAEQLSADFGIKVEPRTTT
jgi:FkbM family methyltransferase